MTLFVKRCKCCRPMGSFVGEWHHVAFKATDDYKAYFCPLDGETYISCEMMPCAETCAAAHAPG